MIHDDLFNWPPCGVRWFGGAGSYSPPPAPTEDNAEARARAEEAAAREKEMLRKRRGRSSTILTGGQGVTDQAVLATPTLLGTKQKLGQ